MTVKPTLLYNDECAVRRTIGRWVEASATDGSNDGVLIVRQIGDDPVALRSLDARLDIWDAYATIHLVMPDGSMKTGGEAVAEVFRRLPNTRWFTGAFALGIADVRPFQLLLNAGYTLLSDVRPLFGCESCGTTSRPVRALHAAFVRSASLFGRYAHPNPHFTSK